MDKRLKRLLAQLNLANQLTFLRLVLIPFFVIAVLEGRFGVALGLFVTAAVTDLLDGLSARMLGGGTALGAYLDPAADKLLLVVAFVLLTDYPVMLQDVAMVHRIPLWLTVLTISRDVLIVAVALLLYLTRTQTRFPPSIWGKLTTVAEFLTVDLVSAVQPVGIADPGARHDDLVDPHDDPRVGLPLPRQHDQDAVPAKARAVTLPGRLDLDPLSRQALEFDALLEIVAADARTDAGRSAVRALSPQTKPEDLERENGLGFRDSTLARARGGAGPGQPAGCAGRRWVD